MRSRVGSGREHLAFATDFEDLGAAAATIAQARHAKSVFACIMGLPKDSLDSTDAARNPSPRVLSMKRNAPACQSARFVSP